MKISILNLSGEKIFSTTGINNSLIITIRKALVEKVSLSYANLSGANLSRANLSGANLSGANLSWANLSRANLSGANLSGADLSGADLSGANLSGANLSGAYLSGAYLSGANLSGANLSWADLSGANLSRANLSGANLSGANLSWANLSRANLSGANLSWAELSGADTRNMIVSVHTTLDKEALWVKQTRILPEGDIIGYKKCENNIIVKLLIPSEAKRSHAFGRKCRAEFAKVLSIEGGFKAAYSTHSPSFIYREGEIVRPREPFSDLWFNECESGIHFFITREEALAY